MSVNRLELWNRLPLLWMPNRLPVKCMATKECDLNLTLYSLFYSRSCIQTPPLVLYSPPNSSEYNRPFHFPPDFWFMIVFFTVVRNRLHIWGCYVMHNSSYRNMTGSKIVAGHYILFAWSLICGSCSSFTAFVTLRKTHLLLILTMAYL